MTEINTKKKVKEIKQKIKQKFRNASRFSTLSGMPYHYIQNAYKKENLALLSRIEKAVDRTENRAIFDEVTQPLIDKVKDALIKKDLRSWCQENGVPHWWLQLFLKGDVRFMTHPRVKRLVLLLDIED